MKDQTIAAKLRKLMEDDSSTNNLISVVGEVLKATWRLAKLQENFSQEAMKARTDKFLSERNEVMNKAAKATRHEGYNNLSIPASAYYNSNSTHYGAHYVGD